MPNIWTLSVIFANRRQHLKPDLIFHSKTGNYELNTYFYEKTILWCPKVCDRKWVSHTFHFGRVLLSNICGQKNLKSYGILCNNPYYTKYALCMSMGENRTRKNSFLNVISGTTMNLVVALINMSEHVRGLYLIEIV